jgi:hypothetical protein
MRPLDRISHNIPHNFFKNLADGTDGAWSQAHKESEKFDKPERPNMLGQLRHAHSEQAFRDAANLSGLDVSTLFTKPAGGCYSLVSSGGVILIRGNIQAHCGIPKPTVFRKKRASVNAWLDPVQLDVFQKVADPDKSYLCAMIVSTYGPKGTDQTIPAFMGIGTPNERFTGWKLLKSFEEISALYHDLDVAARTVYEEEIEVKDIAVPMLKKRD